MSDRDIGLDITRIIAFLSVISVHFFLNSNFYYVAIDGKLLYVMMIARNVFMICVPLFMLLTGYLMSSKQYQIGKDYGKHVSKLKGILIVYILSTILFIVFSVFCFDDKWTLKDIILNILGYKQYSWYINMYIGLYLMIPFLNIIWQKLNEKEKVILVVILSFLTVAPSVFNVYDFSINNIFGGGQLQTSQDYDKLVPDFWQDIYPITYYFIGAKLRETNLKKYNSIVLFLLMIVSFLFFGGYNIWRNYGVNFIWGSWSGWGSLQNTINSILVFMFINSFSFKVNKKIANVFAYISKLTLGAYLISFIPDKILYPKINEYYSMSERFIRFPLIVLTIAGCSLILSAVVNGISDAIGKMSIKRMVIKSEGTK